MKKIEESNNFFKLGIIVLLIWLGSWILISVFIEDPENKGQFGDMFGAINSLFSGLAFAGVIYTILMQKEEMRLQRKELALQREELELTRKELKRSADIQEISFLTNSSINLGLVPNFTVDNISSFGFGKISFLLGNNGDTAYNIEISIVNKSYTIDHNGLPKDKTLKNSEISQFTLISNDEDQELHLTITSENSLGKKYIQELYWKPSAKQYTKDSLHISRPIPKELYLKKID